MQQKKARKITSPNKKEKEVIEKVKVLKGCGAIGRFSKTNKRGR